jgi:hypothetical protein
MSPSTEAGLPEKVAVVQKLAVLLPPMLILLKRIHHIQLTSRGTGDSRNQMDEEVLYTMAVIEMGSTGLKPMTSCV